MRAWGQSGGRWVGSDRMAGGGAGFFLSGGALACRRATAGGGWPRGSRPHARATRRNRPASVRGGWRPQGWRAQRGVEGVRR
eukprot:2186881-Prymnesium_polylepis.1